MTSLQKHVKLDEILFRLFCYKHVKTLRNELIQILDQYPNINPKTGHFSRCLADNILYLDGTLPINYEGNSYNIPINFWIHEGYPLNPPVCFVIPGEDMIVTPHHKYVDSTGCVVNFPYLDRWNAQTNNLTGAIQNIIAMFNTFPPLRAKGSGLEYKPTLYPIYATEAPTPSASTYTGLVDYTPIDYTPNVDYTPLSGNNSYSSNPFVASAPVSPPPANPFLFPQPPSHNPFVEDDPFAPSLYPTLAPSGNPPPYQGNHSTDSGNNVDNAFANVYLRQPNKMTQLETDYYLTK